ncbi:hypothetical protein PMI42_00201 [Bradyrhizobium sp. YR681]|nr:hypothetical protein PMI42_00201 [Bradyrhizobium sp. YR681]
MAAADTAKRREAGRPLPPAPLALVMMPPVTAPPVPAVVVTTTTAMPAKMTVAVAVTTATHVDHRVVLRRGNRSHAEPRGRGGG